MKTNNYNILEIEDISTVNAKRYAAKVIVPEGSDIEYISKIIIPLINEIKKSKNVIRRKNRFQDIDAQVVWIYFSFSTNDFRRSIIWLTTQWIDRNLEYRPYLISNNYIADDVVYVINKSYQDMVNFEKQHEKSKEEALTIINELILESEKLIEDTYKVLKDLNTNPDFDDLLNALKPLKKIADDLFFNKSDIIFPESLSYLDNSFDELQASLGAFL